jgi:hypothetical protein
LLKGPQNPLNQDAIASDEPISRFIFESRKYKISTNSVRPEAFLPDPHNETSVFRTKGQTDSEIWAVGQQIRDKPAIARADLLAEKIFFRKLTIRPDPTIEHKHHAIIENWPGVKHERMMIAAKLAVAASLHFPSNGS